MAIEITKLTADLATRAAGLEVRDQASADSATELMLVGKDVIKKIKAFFGPLKEKIKAAHQELVDDEKAELAKVEPVVCRLNELIVGWRRAEERKREEALEASRRAEEVHRRLEEEALRKVKAAEDAAELERLRLEHEAAELQKKEIKARAAGDTATLAKVEEKRAEIHEEARAILASVERATDAAIDEAAKTEVTLTPAPAVPEAPRSAGAAVRDNWEFEVVDPSAVPRTYLTVDEVKIGKVVRALKGQIEIPGVRIFNRPVMVVIGRRPGVEAH